MKLETSRKSKVEAIEPHAQIDQEIKPLIAEHHKSAKGTK